MKAARPGFELAAQHSGRSKRHSNVCQSPNSISSQRRMFFVLHLFVRRTLRSCVLAWKSQDFCRLWMVTHSRNSNIFLWFKAIKLHCLCCGFARTAHWKPPTTHPPKVHILWKRQGRNETEERTMFLLKLNFWWCWNVCDTGALCKCKKRVLFSQTIPKRNRLLCFALWCSDAKRWDELCLFWNWCHEHLGNFQLCWRHMWKEREHEGFKIVINRFIDECNGASAARIESESEKLALWLVVCFAVISCGFFLLTTVRRHEVHNVKRSWNGHWKKRVRAWVIFGSVKEIQVWKSSAWKGLSTKMLLFDFCQVFWELLEIEWFERKVSPFCSENFKTKHKRLDDCRWDCSGGENATGSHSPFGEFLIVSTAKLSSMRSWL